MTWKSNPRQRARGGRANRRLKAILVEIAQGNVYPKDKTGLNLEPGREYSAEELVTGVPESAITQRPKYNKKNRVGVEGSEESSNPERR